MVSDFVTESYWTQIGAKWIPAKSLVQFESDRKHPLASVGEKRTTYWMGNPQDEKTWHYVGQTSKTIELPQVQS
jgi:hypothetical protein